MKWAAIIAALALPTACSAPAPLPQIATAEQYEHAGEYAKALQAFSAARTTCRRISNPNRRQQACAEAYLSYAAILDQLGHRHRAARAYEAIPSALPDDPDTAARGLYRAGTIYLALGESVHAYRLLWRTITAYPNTPSATDAVDALLADGRRRAPRELYDQFMKLYGALESTRIADNLLYAMADLARHEFHDPHTALALYDRLADNYPKSGLWDDALWHGAQIARALGDPHGAVRRLRRLLASREVAIGPGSYFTKWLDHAQLEVGEILRDDLHDYDGAVAAFEKLPEDYPHSTLRDDALFELAVTQKRMGRRAAACATLARLRKSWPRSKYELHRAPALARTLRCGGAAGAASPAHAAQ